MKKRSKSVQGDSLVSLLKRNSSRFPARYSFSQRRPRGSRKRGWEPGKHHSLQDRNYKYIFHSEGQDEFYHLADDPFEATNLINDPSREKEEMRDTLQQYYSRLLSESNFSYQTGIKPK